MKKYFRLDAPKRGETIKKIYDENFNEIGTFNFTNEVTGLIQVTKDKYLAQVWEKFIYNSVVPNEYGFYIRKVN